jgi:sugar transferase EpsL
MGATRTYRIAKRALDLAVSFSLLVLLGPIMIVTAALVRVFLGAPVLFHQVRPGLHGRPFTIYKFRTMTDARHANGELLADEIRLTRFGRLLRHMSLDELPQLLNVVRGDLSLVGPRPLLVEYLNLYTPEQARRHDVKPGLTGWAQVNGRNALSWDEKFALDTWYVDHQSLALDLIILFLTARRVLRKEGIEGAGNVRFTGAKDTHG